MSRILLQGRYFSKLIITLISFWLSACFIFAAYKLRPGIELAIFGDLGIFEEVGGVHKIQPCGSDIERASVLKKAATKYGGLVEDKFTFVYPLSPPSYTLK